MDSDPKIINPRMDALFSMMVFLTQHKVSLYSLFVLRASFILPQNHRSLKFNRFRVGTSVLKDFTADHMNKAIHSG